MFFQIHSWIGIKLSILFFIVCFSGTLATLSSEMDWLVFPEYRAKVEEKLASKNTIVQNIAKAYPDGKIEYWTAMEVPYLCDLIYIKRGDQRTYVFANQYTGEIQGEAQLTFRRFFRDLHYFLFIPFNIGHFTVLIFGFLLLLSLITSLLFYKKWYRKLFDLKRGKGKVVFYRSLHRLIGVWSIPFMLLFSITGIWYFLERTNTADISETANTATPELVCAQTDSALFKTISYDFDYNKAVKAAQEVIPGIQIKTINPPTQMDRPFYLTGISEVPLVRFRANRVYIHPETYEVLKLQDAEELPTVTWLNDIADPLHFGYWGGLLTKVIWFFAGLAISALILSGIWISMKRKVKGELQQKQQAMGKWKYVNWGVFTLMMILMYGSAVYRYEASLGTFITISLGWSIVGFLCWYIFSYKMQEVVRKELREV